MWRYCPTSIRHGLGHCLETDRPHRMREPRGPGDGPHAAAVALLAAGLVLAAALALPRPAAAACKEGGQSCNALTNCCAGCNDTFNGTCRTCKKAKQGCSGIGRGNCCNDLQCDILGECRHTPGRSGERCGIGVPCASSLLCRSGRCTARDGAGDSCTGIGQGSCQSGLLCDIRGECRHDPPIEGEPCGAGVPCSGDLECDAVIGGRCEACGDGGDGCIGLGQGTCCDDLQCDVSGYCRHTPGKSGEPCGLGVPCEDGLACSAHVGGICQDCAMPGEDCFGLGQGNCCDDDGVDTDNPLVCDFSGQCRHTLPTFGEPCGLGVPCQNPLVCDATVAGRCIENEQVECGLSGGGSCPEDQECDYLCGECRAERPTEGQVCGLDGFLGPQCAQGMSCRFALPCARCEAEKGIGQRCSTSTNCQQGLECWIVDNRCYPKQNLRDSFSDQFCTAIYSPEIHAVAVAEEETRTYSTSFTFSNLESTAVENGAVYSPDGRYGCFTTTCTGVETAVASGGIAACKAVYKDYESVAGASWMVVSSVGVGDFAQFSSSVALAPAIDPHAPGIEQLGEEQCISTGAGISPPASIGLYSCDTVVHTILGELSTAHPSGVAGDANGDGSVQATDSLVSLKSAVGDGIRCPNCVCDLNASGSVTATDSLLALQTAVGLAPAIVAPACASNGPGSTTTTTMMIDEPGVQAILEMQRADLERATR